MNNLLFTTLLIALIYYFFYYLPQQKKLNTANLPLKHHQSTQTETMVEESENILNCPSAQFVPDSEAIKELYEEKQSLLKDIQQKEKTIIGLNQSYEKLEKKKDQEIKELQSQIRNLAKKPTNSKGTQTDSETELTNTLDTLIKDIQQLNNEL